MRQILFFLFLLGSSAACKKNVDIPPEIRPNEFWVHFTATDENGVNQSYAYRGEDKIELPQIPGLELTLGYVSDGDIKDSIKQINAGLATSLLKAPFSLRLNGAERLTDPFTPAEWTKEEVEALLYPGKTFAFGDAPDEAEIVLHEYPDDSWTCFTTAATNDNGYLRILEVEDYGSPEIGVPYFGKKVKLSFAGTFRHQNGATWAIRDGEAVLFFRYYKY